MDKKWKYKIFFLLILLFIKCFSFNLFTIDSHSLWLKIWVYDKNNNNFD